MREVALTYLIGVSISCPAVAIKLEDETLCMHENDVLSEVQEQGNRETLVFLHLL